MSRSIVAPEPITPAADLQDQVNTQHPWLALEPEHFQLLRLSALPADKEVGLRPLRFISLGRVERHSEEESFLRLTLSVPGSARDEHVNTLEVWADHQILRIQINPDFPLQIEPGNRGLGRFLLAQAAVWARKYWNHYTVASQTLLTKHAPTDAARLRRDHTLQAQGFIVTYEAGIQMRALCSVGRVSQLYSDWNTNKISLIDTVDSAMMLQNADKSLNEHSMQIKTLHQRVDLLKTEDSMLRFTIYILVVFAVFQAALLIWIATD